MNEIFGTIKFEFQLNGCFLSATLGMDFISTFLLYFMIDSWIID
jgi:hypothetical protein